MEDLCCVCLVKGRRVWSLCDTTLCDVYEAIHNDPDFKVTLWGSACWECRSLLHRLRVFQCRVRASSEVLKQHLAKNPLLNNVDEIVRPSNLKISTTHTLQCPDPLPLPALTKDELGDTKNEGQFDPVKSEPEEYEEFGAAETFVQDVEILKNSCVDDEEINKPATDKKAKKKKEGKKLKKDKRKKEKHTKPKKPKTREEEMPEKAAEPELSSDGISDLESVADFYNDDISAINDTVESQKSKKSKVAKEEDLVDPSEFEVVTLTYEEMLKERELERQNEYFANAAHQCNDCILGFMYERTLKTHLDTLHSEKAGRYECEACHVRFGCKQQLEAHAHAHLRRYKCVVCGKSFNTVKNARNHAKQHKQYPCRMCSHTSSSLVRHKAHVVRDHTEKPKCVECNKTFSSSKTYKYHLSVIHKGENRFPCPHCGRVYQWKSNLWRHIKNHKARDSGELQCKPCNKKFSSIATLQQHLKLSRKHNKEEEFNYMCSDCGKKFPNKTRLKDHVNWEHLKRVTYRCEKCNKPFKSNTSLYVHLHTVHRDKDKNDNLCHVCGKSYQNAAKLRYHIVAIHTAETPYTCELCPSSFSWYSSLYRHIKEVHENVKKKKRLRRRDGELAAPGAAPALAQPLQPRAM